MDVFFVCGAPKSGTTWLQRILDAHPEVSCSGEGHFIDRFSAPMAKVVSAYNARLIKEAAQVYEGRPYYQPVGQAEFDDVARGFILSRLTARADADTRWVGDKTPAYVLHLNQLHRLFPEARFVHIVRDPRDVAVSTMAHSQRAGLREAFVAGSEHHRLSLEAAMANWTRALSAVDAFAAARPGRVHEVHYRDLHADPVGQSERLFRFLGAPTPRVLLEQIAAATSFAALTGRQPGEEDPSSFLRKGVPGDWKTRLDPESVRRIGDSCGELMRERRFA